jgi:hypothetical protein
MIMDGQLGHVFKGLLRLIFMSSKHASGGSKLMRIVLLVSPLIPWWLILGVCVTVDQTSARNAYSLPLDRILTLSQPAHSEIDPPSEAMMLSFKILRGLLNLDYRLLLLTAICEAFTELVFALYVRVSNSAWFASLKFK